MTNITIGKNIRALRESAGFTPSSLASFMGVEQSFVSKVEKGEQLYILVKAGSVFYPKDKDAFSELVTDHNKNAHNIGFNRVIKNTKTEDQK